MIGLMLMGLLGVVVVMVCVALVLMQLMAESLAGRAQVARRATQPAPGSRRLRELRAPVSQRLRVLCTAVEEAPLSQRFGTLSSV